VSLAVAANSRCELLLRAAGRRTEPPFSSHAFEIVSARLLPAIERRRASSIRAGGRRRRRDEWPPTVRLAAGAHRLSHQHQPARSTICCCSSQKGRAAARGLPDLQPAGNCRRVAQLPAPPDPIPDLLISRGHHRLLPARPTA
jgi:hypothetical protein